MEAPNNRAIKHVKQNLTELKGEIDKSTIGKFNTSLSIIARTRHKIQEYRNIIKQEDLIDICRTLHILHILCNCLWNICQDRVITQISQLKNQQIISNEIYLGAVTQDRGGIPFKQTKIMKIWIYKDVFTFIDVLTKD